MSIAEKLTTVAENVPKVYEAGAKSEYDEFWDNYQNYGKKTHYTYGFAGEGWTNETFKPKYDIVPSNTAVSIFAYSSIQGSLIDILEEQGVKLDFSKMTSNSLNNIFYYASKITELPDIDLSNTTQTTISSMFAHCKALKTIKSLTIPTTVKDVTGIFSNCTSLENIEISGTLMCKGINLQWSANLSHDSIMSIINALMDEPTVTEPTVTISLTAVNSAFETTEGSADGSTSEEWLALTASKPNWTITLV